MAQIHSVTFEMRSLVAARNQLLRSGALPKCIFDECPTFRDGPLTDEFGYGILSPQLPARAFYGSKHYQGRAFDIDEINGQRIYGDSQLARQLWLHVVSLGLLRSLAPRMTHMVTRTISIAPGRDAHDATVVKNALQNKEKEIATALTLMPSIKAALTFRSS